LAEAAAHCGAALYISWKNQEEGKMKNLEKYCALLGGEIDGLLLTSRYSRHYLAEFDIAEGVAIVTKSGTRYFTDSRYIESAQNNIQGIEVLETNRANPYNKLINEAIAHFGVERLGYEEGYLTVAELQNFEENLQAKLMPCGRKINRLREVKEPWELDRMRKAQQITDRAFSEVLSRVKSGMTEKQLQAELIYSLYKNGADGLAFDPIVVSGPNTSLPHGVATDRVIRDGDFVTMDFGAAYQGYCSDMTRTVAVGYATEEMEKVYNTVL
jgi:Xaa-Pro aminopeptidase